MSDTLSGTCLCGDITFEIKNKFDTYYFCHCKQCQHLTGSAFAANAFTDPDNIKWTKGESKVQSYCHPARSFSYAFCKHCGSALPVVTKNKASLLVPVGSLIDTPDIKPQANIFWEERLAWLKQGMKAACYNGFAE